MSFFPLEISLTAEKKTIYLKKGFWETEALEPATRTEEPPILYCSLMQNIRESREIIGQLPSSFG